MATGDPGLDLIGLIGGVVLNGMGASAERRVPPPRASALRDAGHTDPQSWEPYTFEVTTVEATRAGLLRAALVDRVSDCSWPIERNVVEQSCFRVANGRRARDRGCSKAAVRIWSELADVAVWEQGGLRPSLARLSPNSWPRSTCPG